ncbi:helix-turn-helix domain-containing protein [Phascolarctobacterium succinatutens]|uniref:helix-turn-helix domain-containing protein n=1 Tax=Phascolarctobacterium succinatutens TaxID=626940 RepID=UPI0023F9E250|nr:helix-turn-helix transcriptional regulator [Phascolarctobacterium succinatutens]
MKISENIKFFREQRSYSLQDLSKIIKSKGKNVNASTLQRYESGEIKNIPYDMVLMLAEIFSVGPATLMGWVDAPTEEDVIIQDYNKLNPTAQQKLRDYIDDLLSNPKNLRK